MTSGPRTYVSVASTGARYAHRETTFVQNSSCQPVYALWRQIRAFLVSYLRVIIAIGDPTRTGLVEGAVFKAVFLNSISELNTGTYVTLFKSIFREFGHAYK